MAAINIHHPLDEYGVQDRRHILRMTSPSQLDRFQRYLDDQIHESDLLGQLRAGGGPTTPGAWRGIAFHGDMVTRAKTGRWPPATESEFRWEIDLPNVPAAVEVPMAMTVESPGGPVTINGRIDAVDDVGGAEALIEWKTSDRRATPDQYDRSWQWRCYLAARPNAKFCDVEHYHCVKQWKGNRPFHRVISCQTFPFARTSSMLDEIHRHVASFQAWAMQHALDGALVLTHEGRIQKTDHHPARK